MDSTQVLTAIEERIELLTKVRALLSDDHNPTVLTSEFGLVRDIKPKRVLSAKGRANIAAARRKRAKIEKAQSKAIGRKHISFGGMHTP